MSDHHIMISYGLDVYGMESLAADECCLIHQHCLIMRMRQRGVTDAWLWWTLPMKPAMISTVSSCSSVLTCSFFSFFRARASHWLCGLAPQSPLLTANQFSVLASPVVRPAGLCAFPIPEIPARSVSVASHCLLYTRGQSFRHRG